MESGKSTPISAASLDALAKRRLSMASRGPGRGQHEALATARSVIEIMESDGMKLEDSINLSHLVRLMKIFNVGVGVAWGVVFDFLHISARRRLMKMVVTVWILTNLEMLLGKFLAREKMHMK